MTIHHKLLAIKAGVTALTADRDYWKERSHRQEEILEDFKNMIMNSNDVSDDILEIFNTRIKSSLDELVEDMEDNDLPLFDIERINQDKESSGHIRE